MCGIAGWFSSNADLSDKLSVINKMSEKLRARGPDEDGIYLQKNVCLIHRRLTVIDPAGGRQPMTRRFGNELYTIVYNGELYNTEDIRKKLEAMSGIPEIPAIKYLLMSKGIIRSDTCRAPLRALTAAEKQQLDKLL